MSLSSRGRLLIVAGATVFAFLMMHGPTERVGGSWLLRDPFRFDDLALMRHAGPRRHANLMRRGRLWNSAVDEDVEYADFYGPDCVLYVSQRAGWKDVSFFACGDHQPFPFESAGLRPTADGLFGQGTSRIAGGQIEHYRYLIPADSLRAVAMRQPMRRWAWQDSFRPDYRAPVYMDAREEYTRDTTVVDSLGRLKVPIGIKTPSGPTSPLF